MHIFYYVFIITAIYMSVFLIKEIDFGSIKEVLISVNQDWILWLLFLIPFTAIVIYLETNDLVPLLNFVLFLVVYIYKIKKHKRHNPS